MITPNIKIKDVVAETLDETTKTSVPIQNEYLDDNDDVNKWL